MKEIIKDLDVLSERADEVDVRKENNETRQIILDLKNTIRENNLKGLSAPQIGYNKRIFCINFKGDIRTFINPIISQAKGFTLAKETCSSIPGKVFIRPRNNDIQVMYQTPLAKAESRRLVGLAAEVFQHELDHLDGLLLTDIGLELSENYDNLSEDEKSVIIKEYLDSLDIKQKEAREEVENNEELKQMDNAINFMEGVITGKVQLDDKVTITKPADKKEE